MGRPTKAQRAQITQRRARAIEMRIRGDQWQTIADALGYASSGAACNDVARAMEERARELAEQADTLREIELARLDALFVAAWEVLERDHVLVSGGKVVRDGQRKLLDDGPTLSAIDRLLKISERRAKLQGLDSPSKIEATVTTDEQDSALTKLRALLAEARQNRAESDDAVASTVTAVEGNGHNGNGNGANGHG